MESGHNTDDRHFPRQRRKGRDTRDAHVRGNYEVTADGLDATRSKGHENKQGGESDYTVHASDKDAGDEQ